jgi:hypothetical protein
MNRAAMVRGGSRGGLIAGNASRARAAAVEERRQRQFAWTDPRSEWMAQRFDIDIASSGVGSSWSRRTQKHLSNRGGT